MPGKEIYGEDIGFNIGDRVVNVHRHNAEGTVTKIEHDHPSGDLDVLVDWDSGKTGWTFYDQLLRIS